jgi:apolipoprotein D and lipocalin family protein
MLSLFLLFHSTSGYYAPGACPNPSLQANFNLTNYLGLWFDLAHTTDFFWELGGECDTAQYSPSSTAGQIVVFNSEYKNNAWSSYKGSATCQSSSPAHCAVKFFPLAPAGDYRVVETDYTSYSLVFSCMANGSGHDMWFWILARKQNFDPTSLISTAMSYGFPQSEVTKTIQTGCPAPPSPPSKDFLANY